MEPEPEPEGGESKIWGHERAREQITRAIEEDINIVFRGPDEREETESGDGITFVSLQSDRTRGLTRKGLAKGSSISSRLPTPGGWAEGGGVCLALHRIGIASLAVRDDRGSKKAHLVVLKTSRPGQYYFEFADKSYSYSDYEEASKKHGGTSSVSYDSADPTLIAVGRCDVASAKSSLIGSATRGGILGGIVGGAVGGAVVGPGGVAVGAARGVIVGVARALFAKKQQKKRDKERKKRDKEAEEMLRKRSDGPFLQEILGGHDAASQNGALIALGHSCKAGIDEQGVNIDRGPGYDARFFVRYTANDHFLKVDDGKRALRRMIEEGRIVKTVSRDGKETPYQGKINNDHSVNVPLVGDDHHDCAGIYYLQPGTGFVYRLWQMKESEGDQTCLRDILQLMEDLNNNHKFGCEILAFLGCNASWVRKNAWAIEDSTRQEGVVLCHPEDDGTVRLRYTSGRKSGRIRADKLTNPCNPNSPWHKFTYRGRAHYFRPNDGRHWWNWRNWRKSAGQLEFSPETPVEGFQTAVELEAAKYKEFCRQFGLSSGSRRRRKRRNDDGTMALVVCCGAAAALTMLTAAAWHIRR
eukprot:COSAG04_NODE_94_length_26569_cov_27.995127_2_plen_584_part_00